jgi:1-acyl-sn-glycerol-3-phosphate acyltransferase
MAHVFCVQKSFQNPSIILTTHIRLIVRFLFFAAYTSVIVGEIWLKNLLLGSNVSRSMRIRRRWARLLLPKVGVKLTTVGQAPDFPCIVVSNHRSYLDPILMLCDIDGFPVAKAELAKWPLIGKGAKMAGILYLKRENGKSRVSTLRLMLDTVRSGHPVIIFPEGTTSALEGTLPFKKGAFKLAAQWGLSIVPAAVVFPDARDFWVGKDKFLRHAARRFRERTIQATVHYGPVLQGADPERLLLDSKKWIDSVLSGNKDFT